MKFNKSRDGRSEGQGFRCICAPKLMGQLVSASCGGRREGPGILASWQSGAFTTISTAQNDPETQRKMSLSTQPVASRRERELKDCARESQARKGDKGV